MHIKGTIGAITALLLTTSTQADSLPGRSQIDAKVLQNNDILTISKLNRFDVSRLKLIRSLGFKDGNICVSPTPISQSDIDFHRSLFVHDQATLGAADFTLRRTLNKLAADVSANVPTTTAESVFQQLWDTQNDTASAQTPSDNPHCSDNDGKINGFPHNKCPRSEGVEATGLTPDIANRIDNDYKPLALVNRIDLAHKGWRNCGEHRIIYGRQDGFEKNLIIFEAVLPNPKPGCRSGCRDVLEFWTDLSNDSNPASRATKLSDFYFNGLTGFRPVVHTSHYSASGVSSVYGGSGSGQIRTNQFMNALGRGLGEWTLKEFKTFMSCAGGSCDYDLMPISVKGNPYGALWNKDVATGAVVPTTPPPENPFSTTPVSGIAALATNFQSDVIAQVTADKLANPDINSFSYAVDLDKNAAESQSQSPVIDHYRNQFNAASDQTFKNDLNTAAAGFGLTGEQIVNRAAALSCAGCHMPNQFQLTDPNSIGPGLSWPDALAFVHVDTPLTSIDSHVGFDSAHFGGNTQGFNISPALLNEFLPARRNNLTGLANLDVCNCVRKTTLLERVNPDLIGRLKKFLGKFEIKTIVELNEAEKRFRQIDKVQRGDMQNAFAQKKEIIRKAEAEVDEKMMREGIKFSTPSLKPKPVILSDTRVLDKKHKIQAFDKIINSEPPRETITGSFRTH